MLDFGEIGAGELWCRRRVVRYYERWASRQSGVWTTMTASTVPPGAADPSGAPRSRMAAPQSAAAVLEIHRHTCAPERLESSAFSESVDLGVRARRAGRLAAHRVRVPGPGPLRDASADGPTVPSARQRDRPLGVPFPSAPSMFRRSTQWFSASQVRGYSLRMIRARLENRWPWRSRGRSLPFRAFAPSGPSSVISSSACFEISRSVGLRAVLIVAACDGVSTCGRSYPDRPHTPFRRR